MGADRSTGAAGALASWGGARGLAFAAAGVSAGEATRRRCTRCVCSMRPCASRVPLVSPSVVSWKPPIAASERSVRPERRASREERRESGLPVCHKKGKTASKSALANSSTDAHDARIRVSPWRACQASCSDPIAASYRSRCKSVDRPLLAAASARCSLSPASNACLIHSHTIMPADTCTLRLRIRPN